MFNVRESRSPQASGQPHEGLRHPLRVRKLPAGVAQTGLGPIGVLQAHGRLSLLGREPAEAVPPLGLPDLQRLPPRLRR